MMPLRRPAPNAARTTGDALDPWRARWRTLGAREQRALLFAAGLIAVALTWSVALAPAWRTLRSAAAQRTELDTQLARMQLMAAEARALRALPAVAPEAARQALQAATERLGAGARLTLTGEQASVSLTAVPSDALTAWLGEVRSAARARVVDLQLQRQGNGYTGTVVLALLHPA
ncbi:type II secretion system protein M (GspM) [Sphaerotilus hippei]|uniref:Type II secretion system protein M (GspM) n=1 Tax=Sphaerotilus hippei TaxID=744406 RepID=A0A318H1T4_9BURK|nr:type II secretion system protein GspM [Sphaerotilus hippei]PXW97105.1 type II secretion system protein M (GspM) [Sphaerotilus hippei]